MEQIIDFFSNLFGTESWPPRWHCGMWTDFHGWLYICSDLAVWAAYFVIPVFLIKLIKQRPGIPFPSAFWLFAAFILFCGLTHLMDAIIFWWPAYRLSALIRFCTAGISWATIIALFKIFPQVLTLKTSLEFDAEIAERKKVEETLRTSEQKLMGLLESAPDAVVIADKHGKIIIINNQTEKLFGWTKDELIGKEVELLIPQRFQKHHPEHRNNFLKDPKVRGMGVGLALFGKKKNGEEFPVEISLSPMQTSDGLIVSSAIRDITDRKKIEKKLEDYTIELENKNKEIEQFAFLASHDLQEPLRTISNYANLFEKQYKNKLDNNADEYLSYITDGTHRMQSLINDLLEYSRIGRDNSIIEMNCNTILEEVIKDLSSSIKNSDTDIKSEQLPIINGYSDLKSLFQNLISNAIKFRKKNTQPIIHITVKSKDKEWLFAIKDNGIGIDNIYQDKLFKIFQRLHTKEEYPGTGIGLAQCKKIVELHGGKIWIESEPEKGSIFYFTISKNITL